MKTRTDIINYLIMRFQYKRYLEIGVGTGDNFNKIKIESRHSVDPNYPATFSMTSGKFFQEACKDKYDIVFIDGDHKGKAVIKDIQNSLQHLSENGIVLVHDISPTSPKLARNKPKEGRVTWFGSGFMQIVKLRASNPYLFIRTIDTDCGVAIIKPVKEKQELIKTPERISYVFMDQDRRYSLGLISVQEFLKLNL